MMLYYSMIKTIATTEKRAKTFKKVRTPKTPKLNREDVPIEAINKYFVANTAEIFVPDKVVNVDNKGKIKLVDTLTKNKSIKKIKGKPVIKLDDHKNIKTIVAYDGDRLLQRGADIKNFLEKGFFKKATPLQKKRNDIDEQKKDLTIQKDKEINEIRKNKKKKDLKENTAKINLINSKYKEKQKDLDEQYNTVDKKLEKMQNLYTIYSRTMDDRIFRP